MLLKNVKLLEMVVCTHLLSSAILTLSCRKRENRNICRQNCSFEKRLWQLQLTTQHAALVGAS